MRPRKAKQLVCELDRRSPEGTACANYEMAEFDPNGPFRNTQNTIKSKHQY